MAKHSALWLSTLRFLNKETKDIRSVRHIGIKIYSFLIRGNIFLPPPRILLNGPPKSGTHLLSDCLALMPKMMFSGRHFALSEYVMPPYMPWDIQSVNLASELLLDIGRLERVIKETRQGMFITCHAQYQPDFAGLLKKLDTKHVLILRDPRDLVVSHTFFVIREKWHPHHHFYTEEPNAHDKGIMATICGFKRSESVSRPLSHIGEFYDGFLRWSEDESVLVCRFEDLVGARGGGDDQRQLKEIVRLAEFIQRPLTLDQAKVLAQMMYSKKSMTYRKGAIGDWKNYFTDHHKHVFKELAGNLLIKLGYEQDMSW